MLAVKQVTNPGYFQCWRYTKGLHKESCSISDKKAESLIIKSLQQVAANPVKGGEYIQIPSSPPFLEKEQLESALEKLRIKKHKIKAAYENGIDNLDEYRAGKETSVETGNRIKKQIRLY